MLSDSNSNGDVGSALAGGTVTGSNIVNTALSGDSEVYAFIGNSNGYNRGIGALDDFNLTVVPEPSAYALIAGSLALAWIMVRRRN